MREVEEYTLLILDAIIDRVLNLEHVKIEY